MKKGDRADEEDLGKQKGQSIENLWRHEKVDQDEAAEENERGEECCARGEGGKKAGRKREGATFDRRHRSPPAPRTGKAVRAFVVGPPLQLHLIYGLCFSSKTVHEHLRL